MINGSYIKFVSNLALETTEVPPTTPPTEGVVYVSPNGTSHAVSRSGTYQPVGTEKTFYSVEEFARFSEDFFRRIEELKSRCSFTFLPSEDLSVEDSSTEIFIDGKTTNMHISHHIDYTYSFAVWKDPVMVFFPVRHTLYDAKDDFFRYWMRNNPS